MTFVGKILVVVQLVLSVCFMAFAGAVFTYQTNWKDAYEELRVKHQQATADLGEQSALVQKHTGEARKMLTDGGVDDVAASEDVVSRAITELGKEIAESDRLATQVATLKVELDAEKQTNAQAEELFSVAALKENLAGSEADARLDEAEKVRELNRKLLEELRNKDQQLEQTENERFGLQREVVELTERYEEQLLEMARLTKLVVELGGQPDQEPERETEPAPDVEGLVLNTKKSPQTELIEVSIGSDDGLGRGDTLFIYRTADGGKYLGRIQLVYVTPDRAVGTVVERAKNGQIQRGDNASTKL